MRDWGQVWHINYFMRGASHCQHSAAPVAQVHRDFSSLCIQNLATVKSFYGAKAWAITKGVERKGDVQKWRMLLHTFHRESQWRSMQA
jgi:hypothetical protein